ncbi:MAG: sporulation integral membrane protein YtvI [Clostridiales bacterium]|nr:sporulation integral membrane protein YtvI [Clostridiales bacterium]
MESLKNYARIILNILIPLLCIAAVCWLGPKLVVWFSPFVIGWVIAMIANPLVRFLERKLRLVRRHSSILIVILVLALVIGLGYLAVSRLVTQALSLAGDLPEIYKVAAGEVETVFRRFENVFALLPEDVRSFGTDFANNIGNELSRLVQRIASPTVEWAGNLVLGIPNALVHIVVTILSAYFFIVDRDELAAFVKRHLPESGNRYFDAFSRDAKKLVGGYFLAQAKIMFVIAALLWAGFAVLGIRYSFLLAVLVAVLDFLPIFGTGTVLIPWALIKLLSGEYALAAGLALLYFLTLFVRQIIQPKIVGDTLGLSPLWSLFLLYLGFKLHGISGMIVAVPLGILVMKLYQYGLFDSLTENIRLLIRSVNDFRRGK